MRTLLLGLLLVAGCGGGSGGMPQALVGTYSVVVESRGRMDPPTTMNANLASNNGLLLNFIYGISQVRCGVIGASGLTIPRQKLNVSHSTGTFEGVAVGMGSISADGTVDISFELTTPGIDPADGGASDGGTGVGYTITGSRNE